MALALLSIVLLINSALAAPRPEVEVVQVRQVLKRQDPNSIDLGDFLPSSIGLGDFSSLIPTNLGTILPSSIDLSSLIGDFSTLIPSDLASCLPPSDLPAAPTIPPDVASAILTYSDYCHEPSFTGSVGEHYSSYLSEASKWAEDNEPQLQSYFNGLSTNCPIATMVPTDVGNLSSFLASYSYTLPSCGSATQSGPKETGATTAKPTGTGAGAPTTGGSRGPEQATPGAAPQQTALVAVVGVVAGFAGIVAAL